MIICIAYTQPPLHKTERGVVIFFAFSQRNDNASVRTMKMSATHLVQLASFASADLALFLDRKESVAPPIVPSPECLPDWPRTKTMRIHAKRIWMMDTIVLAIAIKSNTPFCIREIIVRGLLVPSKRKIIPVIIVVVGIGSWLRADIPLPCICHILLTQLISSILGLSPIGSVGYIML